MAKALEEQRRGCLPSVTDVGTWCINLGQTLNKPLEWSSEGVIRSFFVTLEPGEWGNCDCEIIEVFRRVVTVACHTALAPATIPLALTGKIVTAIGDWMTGSDHTFIQGNLQAKRDQPGKLSIFFRNECAFFGGLPIIFGGVQPAGERIKALAAEVKELDPDIYAAAEVGFGPGRMLAAELSESYPYIFTRIGPNGCKMESCLFLASKSPIFSHEFIPFNHNEDGMRRGFFLVETSKAWVIVAHLVGPPEKEKAAMRQAQFAQIHTKIEEIGRTSQKEVILVMDANIADQEEYEGSELPENYFDPRNEGRRPDEVNADTATCSDALGLITRGKRVEGNEFEIDDYALRATFLEERSPSILFQEWRRIEGFEPGNPFGAKSDHHGLFVKYTFDTQE